MKTKLYLSAAVLAGVILSSTAIGSDFEASPLRTASRAAAFAPRPPSGTPVQAAPAPTSDDSAGKRDQILKDGPPALEKNCLGCHLADKWEGTNRDRDGWTAIVAEMSKLMDDAKMPHMNDKTFNLIVEYLALTRPQ
jgi:hypothetical protein